MSVPEVRFKGYTVFLESKKVSDIADLTSIKRIHVRDYVKSGVPLSVLMSEIVAEHLKNAENISIYAPTFLKRTCR